MLTVEIDREILEEVEATVTDDGFSQYLLSHTTQFASAAFILDAVLKALDVAKERLNEEI